MNSDSPTRLREAILYVCQNCNEDDSFASTKLNKILWLADTRAYLDLGRPLTGSEYLRLPNGPAPYGMAPAQRAMIAAQELEVQVLPCFDFEQKKPIAKRPANMAAFNPGEISHLDFAIQYFWGMSARAVSELSHENSIGWQIVDDGDLIPWETAFLSNAPMTPEEGAHGLDLAGRFGWAV